MRTLTLLLLLFATTATAQTTGKRPLTQDDYAIWNSVRNLKLSEDGRYYLYTIDPARGDGSLYLHDQKNDTRREIPRGSRPVLFGDGQWLLYVAGPETEALRQAKINKVPKDKQPKGVATVMSISTGETIEIPDADKLYASETVPIIAYIIKQPANNGTDSTKGRKDKVQAHLRIVDLASGDTLLRAAGVEKFFLDKTGEYALYIMDRDSVSTLNLWREGTVTKIDSTVNGRFGQLVREPYAGKRFAYTIQRDTARTLLSELYNVELASLDRRRISSPREGIEFTEHDSVRYTGKGNVLHYALAPLETKKTKDTIPQDEKFVLELWSHTDTILVSEQRVQLKRRTPIAYKAVYNVTRDKSVIVTDNFYSRASSDANNGDPHYSIVTDHSKYLSSSTWDGNRVPSDIYLIDLHTGQKRLLFETFNGQVRLSPREKYLLIYDNIARDWSYMDLPTGKVTDLTAQTGINFYDEQNDVPALPRSYGFGGWVDVNGAKTGKDAAIIYSRNDLWLVDPADNRQKIKNITQDLRNGSDTKYSVIVTSSDSTYLNYAGDILISTIDRDSRERGLYRWATDKKGYPAAAMQLLDKGNYMYNFRARSRDGHDLVISRENFTEFPDLYAIDLRAKKPALRRFTNANPQQEEFLWGTTQKISWDNNGKMNDGVLFLPENYDPGRKYPVVIYFYEKVVDDNLNRYRIPSPSRSTINPTMFLSDGYVVLMPDIEFEVGYPGRSGLNAVVSGAKYIIEQGIADPKRIGIQGQSWGGYMVNYIITRTDMFACASSGAPVSNMTSAYGNVRDDSGKSRMFQYEAGQSRIGQDLWDGLDLYLENSPIFHARNINTPLLMRHSDNDNAVPFSQGVEMFNVMRRLGKPVWLLDYKGQLHNMSHWEARVDWSIRMHQFFDHYLKDAPMPRWMKEGMRANERTDMKLDY